MGVLLTREEATTLVQEQPEGTFLITPEWTYRKERRFGRNHWMRVSNGAGGGVMDASDTVVITTIFYLIKDEKPWSLS